MKIKNKFSFLLFFLIISCSKSQNEITIIDEPCNFITENGKKYLICDENKSIKILIKSNYLEKRLKNCKRSKSIVTIKNEEKINTSIICETSSGYQIIK